ncbi:MAG: hypothetical protein KJP22_08725 [Acidimicrobiia bacterium]|nr:hypothetical protein [Acidimicrobiia bacterium]MBT8193470.1 hypothetical protein [Acidimicrobiia bacterium]MBT8247343.1 hypothetical protein [Acidimicrobiia bacterium]NNF86899.1 hypothetical protein [Acidimicrobiia bacterium]NNJ47777.1 hypothetical protein [Acidimicrobiia bacterium]
MSPEEEEEERIKRAAQRAGYHLVKAASEVLAAISAVLEELRGPDGDDPESRVVHIDVE